MNNTSNELTPHWLVVGATALTLVAYIIIGRIYGHELMLPLAEDQRVILRTVFYILVIIGFPITNLIRHIQLRLNQTMPGEQSAKNRYWLTVLVSMLMMESIGLLGFLMFMLGDDFNTLYIFTGLAILGLVLYRPKQDEYVSIVEALNARKLEDEYLTEKRN